MEQENEPRIYHYSPSLTLSLNHRYLQRAFVLKANMIIFKAISFILLASSVVDAKTTELDRRNKAVKKIIVESYRKVNNATLLFGTQVSGGIQAPPTATSSSGSPTYRTIAVSTLVARLQETSDFVMITLNNGTKNVREATQSLTSQEGADLTVEIGKHQKTVRWIAVDLAEPSRVFSETYSLAVSNFLQNQSVAMEEYMGVVRSKIMDPELGELADLMFTSITDLAKNGFKKHN
jgi:hypothetical protein